jgi:MFS transporter, OFA family, oxalate/formate antiporter
VSLLVPLESVLAAGGNGDRLLVASAAICIAAGLAAELILSPMLHRFVDLANARNSPTA